MSSLSARVTFQIIVFIILATFFSGITRDPFFGFYRSNEYSLIESFALVAILIGWGPALASLCTSKLFKSSNISFSLLGSWSIGSWISIITPPLILSCFGVSNNSALNPHLFGTIIGILLVLYTLGEEIGWRGYLNSQLKSHTILLRAVITGTVWWFWHLPFLSGSVYEGINLSGSLTGHFTYWGILVAISALFSSIVDRNKSVMQVAAFHAIGNIAIFAGGLNYISQGERWKIAGIGLVSLLVIDYIWQKKQKLVK